MSAIYVGEPYFQWSYGSGGPGCLPPAELPPFALLLLRWSVPLAVIRSLKWLWIYPVSGQTVPNGAVCSLSQCQKHLLAGKWGQAACGTALGQARRWLRPCLGQAVRLLSHLSKHSLVAAPGAAVVPAEPGVGKEPAGCPGAQPAGGRRCLCQGAAVSSRVARPDAWASLLQHQALPRGPVPGSVPALPLPLGPPLRGTSFPGLHKAALPSVPGAG